MLYRVKLQSTGGAYTKVVLVEASNPDRAKRIAEVQANVEVEYKAIGVSSA